MIEEYLRDVSVCDEGQADSPVACFHRNTNFVLVRLDILRKRYIRADLVKLHSRAVDAEFDLLFFRVTAIQRADGISDRHPRDQVLAVSREVVTHEHAAS